MPGQFHFQLDLPVSVLAPSYQLEAPPDPRDYYSYLRATDEMLSEEFKDWLESKHLHPRKWALPVLFYAHPGTATVVHTDLGCKNIWALNVVLGPGELDIHWHTVNIEDGRVDPGNPFIRYPDDSPIIESVVATNNKVTVSRIGMAHSSRNTSDKGVWLMSLRVAPEDLAWIYLKGRMQS